MVVVVVGHEILHRVLGEKLFELAVELGREGFVVGYDEGWLPVAWMTLAMVKVLPEPVTPSKVWNWLPSLKPLTRGFDRLRLVAGGLIF